MVWKTVARRRFATMVGASMRCRRRRPESPAKVLAIAGYQDSLSWHELAQLRVVAFQPVLAISSLVPLLCVAALTVVEL